MQAVTDTTMAVMGVDGGTRKSLPYSPSYSATAASEWCREIKVGIMERSEHYYLRVRNIQFRLFIYYIMPSMTLMFITLVAFFGELKTKVREDFTNTVKRMSSW